MGKYSGQRWSQLLRIDDECLAFDFDQCCALRLRIDDAEREQRQLEAVARGTMGSLGMTSRLDRPPRYCA